MIVFALLCVVINLASGCITAPTVEAIIDYDLANVKTINMSAIVRIDPGFETNSFHMKSDFRQSSSNVTMLTTVASIKIESTTSSTKIESTTSSPLTTTSIRPGSLDDP